MLRGPVNPKAVQRRSEEFRVFNHSAEVADEGKAYHSVSLPINIPPSLTLKSTSWSTTSHTLIQLQTSPKLKPASSPNPSSPFMNAISHISLPPPLISPIKTKNETRAISPLSFRNPYTSSTRGSTPINSGTLGSISSPIPIPQKKAFYEDSSPEMTDEEPFPVGSPPKLNANQNFLFSYEKGKRSRANSAVKDSDSETTLGLESLFSEPSKSF